DEVGKGVSEVHQARNDPSVDARQADLVAEHAVRQVGKFVGNDDGSAWFRHTRHLAQRSFGIVEVIEPTDTQYGIELTVVKRQDLSLSKNETNVPIHVTAPAGRELGERDVDTEDRPVFREPRRVDPVTDGHVEQPRAALAGEVAENDLAR